MTIAEPNDKDFERTPDCWACGRTKAYVDCERTGLVTLKCSACGIILALVMDLKYQTKGLGV